MRIEDFKFPDLSSSQLKVEGKKDPSFKELLKEYIQKVMDVETEAMSEVEKLVKNETSDLHNVMISIEKADLTFQLMMQIRNKIISAYEEIMRMQV